jgi:hypothetical protein
MSEISLSFDNLDCAEHVKDSLHRAFRNSMQELGKTGRRAAEERVTARGSVASGDLLESFSTRTIGTGGNYTTILENRASYAKYVNDGVRGIESGVGPHQYTNKKPPIEPLARWAALKLGGYRVNWEQSRIEPIVADD